MARLYDVISKLFLFFSNILIFNELQFNLKFFVRIIHLYRKKVVVLRLKKT